MKHHFKKQYGQNFLRGTKFAQKLVDGLEIKPGDIVVEIGPGEGVVTSLLLKAGARVIAVEIDYDLVVKLVKRFGSEPALEILHADILNPQINLPKSGYKLAGSLPYNISKQIIENFIATKQHPEIASFIVQAEVAQDYAAKPPKASFLSNWIQIYSDVKKLETIPSSQFFPKPKVDGAILLFKPKLSGMETKDMRGVTRLLRVGFAAPRKTLLNNLKSNKDLDLSNIDTLWEKYGFTNNTRPAELTFAQWQNLYYDLSN